MAVPIYQVDAFTPERFKGNPAAVCLLSRARDLPWMQSVAAEMNLSETAFVVPEQDGTFSLRWCTPTVEVALCGHATLASAHVLLETGRVDPDAKIVFKSKSGSLGARKDGEWIELDFPARPEQAAVPPVDLSAALGVQPAYVGRNMEDFLVLLDSERAVRTLKPDYSRLRPLGVRGVMVTAASDSPSFDFVSRFFAPGAGIDEDPVTGSAHCCLGPFWESRLHRSELLGYQASPRGGVVRVRVAGNRVYLGGQAVTVLQGTITE